MEKEEKHFTLVFVRKNDQVLLGQRKRGHINMRGKWNGFGGKVEKGEEILDAAVREVREECGIDVDQTELKYVGKFTGNTRKKSIVPPFCLPGKMKANF